MGTIPGSIKSVLVKHKGARLHLEGLYMFVGPTLKLESRKLTVLKTKTPSDCVQTPSRNF